MKKRDSDAIVIGAGLMGASAASALVKRGKRVIVLDAHDRRYKGGSSHGDSRITRTLSSEARAFPKLAAESREAMRALETTPGEILRPMPAVFIMKNGSDAHRDALKQQQSQNQHAKQLNAAEAEAAYGLKLRPDEITLVDSEAAVFNPRLVLERLDMQIEKGGEPIRFNCEVIAWSSEDEGVSVTTRDGGTLQAEQLVIATGGWTPNMMRMGDVDRELPPLPAMNVYAIPLFYFEYPSAADQDVIPVTLLDDGKVEMYAMPDGSGAQKLLKVGFHQNGNLVPSPTEVPDITEQEKLHAREYMEARLGCRLNLSRTELCLYAKRTEDTPVVGLVPGTNNVFVASYGGGNCAKHALALGHALCNLMCSVAVLEEFTPGRALQLPAT